MPDHPLDADDGAAVLTGPLRAFLERADVGVLAVHRRDGTVHQSVVYHVLDGGRLLISTEPDRLKARAVERDGWASYCVHGTERPYPALSLEGPARVLREGVAGPTTALFAKIFGQPPEPLTDEAVLAMNRVVIELTPTRVYGRTYLEA